jgi:cell division protein FtsQ
MNSDIKNNNLKNEQEDTHQYKTGMHKISLQEIFIILSIAIIMVFVIYRLNDPSIFPIKQVRIEGEFRQLSTFTLQKSVEDKVRGGFFNIDVTAIREAVLKEPWVYDVSVHRVWPDGLRVSVKEQVAISRWKNTGLLNKEGELFSPDAATYPVELPSLDGPTGTEKLLMSKYQQINLLLEKLDMQLVQLKLNDRRAWTFVLNNDLRVIVGRSDIDERVTRFIHYVPLGLKEKLAQAKQIDMRYTNGFAVQWSETKDKLNVEQADVGQGA